MSLETVVDERYALWSRALEDWGFELEQPPRVPRALDEVLIRGVWPEEFEPPQLTVSIQEVWAFGRDPDRLRGATLKNCYLEKASWHAQFHGTDWEGLARQSERFDLDRTKLPALRLHRHPLGEINGIRRPETGVPDPKVWLHGISVQIQELKEVDEMD